MKTIPESALLTLAAIREPNGKGLTEYLFNEKARIFVMPTTAKSSTEMPKLLGQAIKTKHPVRVQIDPTRGILERIELASASEAKQFHKRRARLDKPDKPQKVMVKKIDPKVFNVVGKHLKAKAFQVRTKIVPDLKKAKAIFDFCAQQSCHLPGPYGIPLCIPFQYVPDGCYARAHKMRWIITTKFQHQCEKVFSFANQSAEHLAVQATKWGGCCVEWWYHVAPLIRVRTKAGSRYEVKAMVIDPGMFDEPVLLSTWLAAQENTTCYATANVSMFSIQPGSAYSPANYEGTEFVTDDLYEATDSTLIGYKTGITCG